MVDAALSDDLAPAATVASLRPLGEARPGDRGVIARVEGRAGALAAEELERRLLELGFVEGAQVEVLHQGLFGRDPIALKVDDSRIALRRREAQSVLVAFEGR
jgi:ferrous iron transport protein A